MTELTTTHLGLLLTFSKLMETQSVSRAAEEMSVSQSATSHNLRRLRTLFDDPLFVRVGATMQPTERALALEGPVSTAMQLLSQTVRSSSSFLPKISDHIFRFAVTDYMETVVLHPLLALLRREAPNVRLVCSPCRDSYGTDSADSLEVIFAEGGAAPTHFHELPLWREDFCVLAASNHPRLGGKFLSPLQYANEKHAEVSTAGKPNDAIDSALRVQGLVRTVQFVTTGYLALGRLVAQSDLIATVPKRAAQVLEKQFQLRMFPTPVDLPVHDFRMAWSPVVHKSPAHAWLRTLIADNLPEVTLGPDANRTP